MRRFFLAAETSVLAIGVLFACYYQGVLTEGAFFQIGALVLVALLVFYLVFRSGLNLKATDPSLTVPQMLAATLVALYAMYSANAARGVFLILLLMAFLFGVLRLRTKALLLYALFILAAYGAVIGLLWQFKPQTLDLGLEFLQWQALALTLPWFALMGGYLSDLREQLRKSNAEQQAALQTVRASETSLAEAQRIAHLGSWSYQLERDTGSWSVETYRIFGVDPTGPAPVGEAFLQLIHVEDRQCYRQLKAQALCKGQVFEGQFRTILAGGEIRWVHLLAQPVVNAGGKTVLLHGTVMDITERKQLEQRHAMEHAVTRLLAESDTVGEAIPKIIRTLCETLGWSCGARWWWDEQGRLLRCAETWSIASSEVREFVTSSSQQHFAPTSAGLIRRVWTTGEPVWIADVSREPGFLRAPIASNAGLHGAFAFPIKKGAGLCGVMEFYTRDARQPDPALLRVTRSIGLQIGQFMARKEAEEEIRQLAHFDFLTGLPNRNMFNELLAHALGKAQRRGNPLAILFIDLDGFKQINDNLGHDAGDCLLTNFAQRLRKCLRRSDVTARPGGAGSAARLGGDEFVVLIDDFAEPSDLAVVAQRILAIAAKPFDLAGPAGRVTASIGISVYPSDGTDIDSLCKHADSAMYCAKQAGKNKYRFFAETVHEHA